MTTKPVPPVAAPRRTETRIHGYVLEDNYRWLREKENPEVISYLEAENAYTDAMMAHTAALQDALYAEMMGHIKQTDVNVPWKQDGYYYFSRWEEGRQYPIFARRKGSLEAEAVTTLDVNELAVGESFMQLRSYEPSPDTRLLAYSTDNTGFRQYTLRIRDLATGKDLPDRAEKTGSIAWSADSKFLFYTVEDHAKRHWRVYRHKLGDDTANDTLVFEEPDERFMVGVGTSRSGKYIFLQVGSHTTTEAHFIEADKPLSNWTIIAPREQDIEYYPEHIGNHFYIRANDRGRNFRLVTAPVDKPARENWVEAVATRDDVMLEDFEPFESFYVLCEIERGLPQFTVVQLSGGGKRRIKFPEPIYSAHAQQNREFSTGMFRYSYESLVTPPSVFDYDVASDISLLLKQKEIPGGYDPALYGSERVWATAQDGVEVPISVVYRKDLAKKDGTNPLYIDGYGSYGIQSPPHFDSNRLSLLDRGVVMAYAQIRGGGDLGQHWHDEGRMMKKMNSFTDFIACAEHLAAQKYGARNRIAIEGGSAGGLLMGAVTNLRPDLFRAVVSHVAFVDVMNTMLDASLPLTVGEYEEWGNPNEKDAYDYMISYSPYDNLMRGNYPAILMKTALNDSQVMYWEPAKYTAKLRTLKTDTNPLLLKTNMAAGHGGASGRYDHLKEIALDYAFILWQLDVEKF